MSGSQAGLRGAVVDVVVVETVGVIVGVVLSAFVVDVGLRVASVVSPPLPADVLLVEELIDGVAVVLDESISDPPAEQAARM